MFIIFPEFRPPLSQPSIKANPAAAVRVQSINSISVRNDVGFVQYGDRVVKIHFSDVTALTEIIALAASDPLNSGSVPFEVLRIKYEALKKRDSNDD